MVRLSAPDLQRAQRSAARIHADGRDVAVILDIAVAVPGDYRTVAAAEADDTVRYAGTVSGLTGLIADIHLAGVADGVTLVPSAGVAPEDLRQLGRDVLTLLAGRERKTA